MPGRWPEDGPKMGCENVKLFLSEPLVPDYFKKGTVQVSCHEDTKTFSFDTQDTFSYIALTQKEMVIIRLWKLDLENMLFQS